MAYYIYALFEVTYARYGILYILYLKQLTRGMAYYIYALFEVTRNVHIKYEL